MLKNCDRMRVNWLAMWYRLTPFWLSLWLIASFAKPTIAGHIDCNYCAPCTAIKWVQSLDQCCEQENVSPLKAGQSLDNTNCQPCCETTAKHGATHFANRLLVPATIGTPFEISQPIQREIKVCFRTTTLKLVSLPRPPPRGRAPPSAFSVHQI